MWIKFQMFSIKVELNVIDIGYLSFAATFPYTLFPKIKQIKLPASGYNLDQLNNSILCKHHNPRGRAQKSKTNTSSIFR